MSRYRLVPTPEQEAILRQQCAHARYVWNLAVEQQSWWRPGRRAAPGYCAQAAQLTQARAEHRWLRDGSQAPGRVEKNNPAYTSQQCSACGHVAADSRESQALFHCVACGYTCHADVNAARNIAAGHCGGCAGTLANGQRMNREPQLLAS